MKQSLVILIWLFCLTALATAQTIIDHPVSAPSPSAGTGQAVLPNITINKIQGSESALDIHLDGSGHGARWILPNGATVAAIGGAGGFQLPTWIIVSGTYRCYPPEKCNWEVKAPSLLPAMFETWADVPHNIISRVANDPDLEKNTLFLGMGRYNEQYVFKIRPDGALAWSTGGNLAYENLKVIKQVGQGSPSGACVNGSEFTQTDDDGHFFFCRGGHWQEISK